MIKEQIDILSSKSVVEYSSDVCFGCAIADEIVEYERTPHPSIIKTWLPYRFVDEI